MMTCLIPLSYSPACLHVSCSSHMATITDQATAGPLMRMTYKMSRGGGPVKWPPLSPGTQRDEGRGGPWAWGSTFPSRINRVSRNTQLGESCIEINGNDAQCVIKQRAERPRVRGLRVLQFEGLRV